MASFTCGTCQFSTTASDAHIGRSTKCPKCDAINSVVPDVVPSSGRSQFSPAVNTVEDFSRKVVQKISSLEKTGARDTTLPKWAANTIAITFALLGILSAIGTLLLILALASAQSAPQEAAVGAMFAALFIAGYVVARSVEKVVRALCHR